MSDLREKLIAAELACEFVESQWRWNTNAQAADFALPVVAEWLRDEAEELRLLAKDAEDRRLDGDPSDERHRERFRAQYEVLRSRADSIAPPKGDET
jgi:hypothetical protein